MFISAGTVSDIAVSSQMVFAARYVPLGPTAGAAIRILLTETLRISFGTAAVG